jgi:hypothetical protein
MECAFRARAPVFGFTYLNFSKKATILNTQLILYTDLEKFYR